MTFAFARGFSDRESSYSCSVFVANHDQVNGNFLQNLAAIVLAGSIQRNFIDDPLISGFSIELKFGKGDFVLLVSTGYKNKKKITKAFYKSFYNWKVWSV